MTQATQIQALDLSKTYPRSPNALLGSYVILARTIDKCRADIAGTPGEYHWNCPLADLFFTFKEIDPMAFRAQLEAGKSDEEILDWLNKTGRPRTEEEILAWSYDCRWMKPHSIEKKAYVEKTVRETSPDNLYIQSYFQMLDKEEGRL
jgi:hypothetical protein